MRDSVGSVQSVLVLGGGSEIAQATATALARRRADTIVLAARRPDGLEGAAARLRREGARRVEAVAFDATDLEGHVGFVDDVWERFGDFDLVLLAFGVLGEQEVAERDPAAAVAVVQTNFTGAVSVGVPIARRLRRQGHGTFVVLSSVAGERARRANFVYGASKAGLDAFFQGLGDSLAGSGARVVVVRPGFVRTRMTEGMEAAPLATTPEHVADAIVRGVAQGRETIWVPASLRWVMSVIRHLPRPLFRRLPR